MIDINREKLPQPGRPQRIDDFLAGLAAMQIEYIAGGAVGVLALHAGVDIGTGEIAQEIANQANVSMLSFRQPGLGIPLHVKSSLYDPDACTELRDFLLRSHIVISLHGHSRSSSSNAIFVGGRNRLLARKVTADIRREVTDVEVIGSLRRIPSDLRGLNRANPVNCSVGGGVQLELPTVARGFLEPDEEARNADGTWGFEETPARQGVIEGLLRFIDREI